MSDSNFNLKKRVVVSACLAGLKCRYDCKSQERAKIVEMVKSGEAVPVCPEQMGGLSTPRPPAEQRAGKVITQSGTDVTFSYIQGAEEALKIVKLTNADEVYLKSRSPMCGVGKIYDGTFTGTLTEGNGIFAELCLKNKIKVHAID